MEEVRLKKFEAEPERRDGASAETWRHRWPKAEDCLADQGADDGAPGEGVRGLIIESLMGFEMDSSMP